MRKREEYKPEFTQAVRLVEGGLTASQVARDLGVGANVVARWFASHGRPDRRHFPVRVR
jgi:transposase-like protein